MADSELSALTAISVVEDADLVYIVDSSSGTGHKMSMSQLTSYIESRGRQHNAATVAQTLTAATDNYLAGSAVTIPTGRAQAKTMYRFRMHAIKTAAGTATPIVNLRIGTAGTVADTSRGTLTFAAQTAVVDEALFEFYATFRSTGSGTSAVIHTVGMIDHRLATTGFSTVNESIQHATSGGFDSTAAGLQIGLSVNPGASAAWTIHAQQAELVNLA